MKVLTAVFTCATLLAAQTPPAKAPAAPAAKSGDAPATKSGAAPATKSAPAPAKSAAPNPRLMTPALLTARAPDLYRAKFTTTHGDFVVEVTRAWAPLGADRFYNLVRNRYFTDASFFRYVANFIVQFGIHADPKVAAVWQNANIKDDPVKESNKKGTLVFATAGPNTRTTQLFINLKDNGSALDGQGFAAFGKVTEGMEIVEGLYSGYGGGPDEGGRGPRQELIQSQGKAYLDKGWPKLDSIKSATIIFPEAPAPAAKKAVTGAPPPPPKKTEGAPATKAPAAPPKK